MVRPLFPLPNMHTHDSSDRGALMLQSFASSIKLQYMQYSSSDVSVYVIKDALK